MVTLSQFFLSRNWSSKHIPFHLDGPSGNHCSFSEVRRLERSYRISKVCVRTTLAGKSVAHRALHRYLAWPHSRHSRRRRQRPHRHGCGCNPRAASWPAVDLSWSEMISWAFTSLCHSIHRFNSLSRWVLVSSAPVRGPWQTTTRLVLAVAHFDNNL